MANGQRSDVLRQFQTLFTVGTVGCLSDGELLDRSASRSGAASEVAFAALVERHGPMVLRVCRKALGDPHEAHDAFQSTFLILARKADAIRRKDSVASWLHGVALRVSAASRASAARRRRHERARAGASPLSTVMEDQPDLGGVLHEEVGRLPSRYREAVVLCYLEGRTYEEVAGRLQVPVGTVKSRLAWARERLRVRLSSRGFAPASGALATLLAAESAQAAVPLPSFWVETTTEAAIKFAATRFAVVGSGVVPGSSAALAQGVMHAMILNNLKLVATAGAMILAASGIGLVAQDPSPSPAPASSPLPSPAPSSAADPAPAPAVASSLDNDRLDKLESKLDRLISVLEKTTVSGQPAQNGLFNATRATSPLSRASAPAQVQNLPTPAIVATPSAIATTRSSDSAFGFEIRQSPPSTARFETRAVAPVAGMQPNSLPTAIQPAGVGTIMESTSAKRLAEIEARLTALEAQMKRLGAASEDQPAQNTLPSPRPE